MNVPIRPGAAVVYANFGRWVAECPCSGATEFGTPGNPPLLAGGWRCVECDGSIEAIWPDPDMMYGIVRLLGLRRYRKNMNWYPGETLLDLMNENLEHGVGDDPSVEAGADGLLLFLATDDRILLDRLPLPTVAHRELEWSPK